MPKLTETTNDKLRAKSDGSGSPQLHVVAAHEPLPGENYQFPTVQVAYGSPQPTPLPVPPPLIAPPQKKRGRKAKSAVKPQEQIVNPAPALQPLKIALIGTAPSSRMLAPYNDPSWKIWGCSPGNHPNILPRIDAWFEVHGVILLEPKDAHYAPQYIEWMKNLKVPLFMQDQRLCPNAITIPKDFLVAEFGPYFFTSSFAYMMAMAIMEISQLPLELRAQSEIRLYGIDMASREEYIIQRPGAYHFFQEASRRGIKISAPLESDIMQPPPLYGYSDVTPMGTKLRTRQEELRNRVAPMEQQLNSLRDTVTYLKGAMEDIDYVLCIQGGAQDNLTQYNYLDRLRNAALTAPTQTVKVSATLDSQ